MSKDVPFIYSVEVRYYEAPHGDDLHEAAGIGEPYVETVFESQNRREAVDFFESLKDKTHKIQNSARHSWEFKRFFEARIAKHKLHERPVGEWSWLLKRYIDIAYRCKIKIDGKEQLVKKLYYVPATLIPSHEFPNDLDCRASKALACGILRKFLPIGSFELVKISASYEINLL